MPVVSPAESSPVAISIQWPPEATSFDRDKGSYDQLVVDDPSIAEFVGEFNQHNERTGASRLTVQLVASKEAVEELHAQTAQTGVQVEAAVPLAGEDNEGLFLTYTAANGVGRRTNLGFLALHQALIQRVVNSRRERQDPRTALETHRATLETKGFEPHFVDRDTPDDEKDRIVTALFNLYRKFGHDKDDVADILSDPLSLICYIADPDGEIVSTSLAETGVLPVAGMPGVRIAEITEGVTRRRNQREGLYTAVSGLLVAELLRRNRQANPSERLNAVIGEVCLEPHGALIAADRNGRRVNAEDGKELFGFNDPGFGILQKNVGIDVDTSKLGQSYLPYMDFAVTYLQRNELG